MNPKRIGILTYHRSNNYGAFMQAYSLLNRLVEDFPECEVSVIDYLSKEVYLLYHQSIWNNIELIFKATPFRRKLTYLKLFLGNLRSLLTHKKSLSVNDKYFAEALKTLPLSNGIIISDSLKQISSYINDQFDIVVVGSDAVWNWQTRKFPNVYFLGDGINTIKLSYAASSYGQPFKNSTDKQKAYIASAWKRFSYIGVRDSVTEDFVKWIDKDLCPIHNCDPTVFLNLQALPVNVSSVRDKLKKEGFDFAKRTIGLMAKSNVAKFVSEELGDEYQIVSVFNKNEGVSMNLLDLTPFEWAIVFSFFDLTITHYFHGNLLSLKNGTPTLVIEEKTAYNQQYCSKIRDFMQRINLESSCYYLDDLTSGTLKEKVDSIIEDPCIVEKMAKELNKEANNYYSFKDALRKAINEY